MKTIKENIELDYSEDIMKDNILHDIKNITYDYLSNKASALDYEEDYLYIALDFLNKKYNEISKLKEDMKIQYYNSPFREISESMDNITLTHQLYNNEEPHIIRLTKDISYLLNDLSVHHGIIGKIIAEREELLEEMMDYELSE